MYLSRGGHGIQDVTSSSVSFLGWGILKLERKEKKEKRKKNPPLESSPVRERTEKCTYDSSLSERERERERERKRKSVCRA